MRYYLILQGDGITISRPTLKVHLKQWGITRRYVTVDSDTSETVSNVIHTNPISSSCPDTTLDIAVTKNHSYQSPSKGVGSNYVKSRPTAQDVYDNILCGFGSKGKKRHWCSAIITSDSRPAFSFFQSLLFSKTFLNSNCLGILLDLSRSSSYVPPGINPRRTVITHGFLGLSSPK
jgi:hypothetical protein